MYLHIGSEVTFKIMSGDPKAKLNWSSSNHNVIRIDPYKGTAVSTGEGKSEIMLSNNINAASIVHVSKVQFAELEP